MPTFQNEVRTRSAPPRKRWGWSLTVVASIALAACGNNGPTEPTEPRLTADATTIVDAAAVAMGNTESVRFSLAADGAPVYIDQFETIAMENAVGEFKVPGFAQAVLDVRVNDNLNTQLAAKAIEDEVWLSSPVTGEFERLPPNIDLDPSRFFDPKGGWQPLLENLTDVRLLGLVERDDNNRYHLTATAPAAQIEIITAGLVRGEDVDVELWVQPVTGRVRVIEFTTPTSNGDVSWVLKLDEYGAEFEFTSPEEDSS